MEPSNGRQPIHVILITLCVCVCVCVCVFDPWQLLLLHYNSFITSSWIQSSRRSRISRCVDRTGWRRLIGCLKLQVIFRKRVTNYRALLQKMTYEDTASYDFTPPCSRMSNFLCIVLHWTINWNWWMMNKQRKFESLGWCMCVCVRASIYASMYAYICTCIPIFSCLRAADSKSDVCNTIVRSSEGEISFNKLKKFIFLSPIFVLRF